MDNHEQSTNTDSAVEPAHRKAKTGKKIAVVGAIIVACSAGGFGSRARYRATTGAILPRRA
jgi:hypothetical protein